MMNTNKNVAPSSSGAQPTDGRLPEAREKIMSYEEKTVGSTQFFKCEACPYMALAEDDIKFHLFTEHPDLAKRNGLADNIQISCPGCSDAFDAEETLRNHLRNHHKMGIKDVKKMIKSLVQIALKDAKLKREDKSNDPPPPADIRIHTPDVRIPQVIEIPDVSSPSVSNNESLPKGVAFISVDELNKMSTPNFEKFDPKEIIQEASINIVYTNEVAQFVNVSKSGLATSSCSVLQLSSVTPDLISSIQPRVIAEKTPSPAQPAVNSIESMYPSTIPCKKGRPKGSKSISVTNVQSEVTSVDTRHIKLLNTDYSESESEVQEILGIICGVNGCEIRMKAEDKLAYHRKCHRDDKFHCAESECGKVCTDVDALHTHLWKQHAIDMELPTCDVCGFKTFKKYRLFNIHMKIHGKIRANKCSTCSKTFKSSSELSKHRLVHRKESNPVQCSQCHLEFRCERRLSQHIATVHDKLRPHKCTKCPFTAAKSVDLKLHIRSHTGEKPYSCDTCMFQCADHNSLRRHKKTHTKEMPYKCKYCPYTSIQSARFTSHMIITHPTLNTDLHKCPYCKFKSVSKEKYVIHLTTHTDKEGIQLFIEMTKNKAAQMSNQKPNWTITVPSSSSSTDQDNNQEVTIEQNEVSSSATSNTIDVDAYDCDSLSENMPQDYSKTYSNTNHQQPDFNNQAVQDLSKDDNNSDCLISESSSDTLMERHQYPAQIPLSLTYDNNQSNIHGYLPNVSLNQNLILQNNTTLTTNLSAVSNNLSNNIMSNFPIRLPPAPQISRSNITLTPVDKISIPITSKVTGPIIKPTQILPVPSSSNSPPVNFSTASVTYDCDGAPRKKPKISVKSNLVLKGPDQVNMFHSQQKMAFRQLEDSERFGCPMTFNNLISTQYMLQPEAALESPGDMAYQEPMMEETAATPVDTGISDNTQIFTFDQQMNVNQMPLLPPAEKIQTTDPSYIKLEANIKQNTQSPSLERMCNANLLNNHALTREYKASPPLEDIHKNMSEIKNEVKSDYYNQTLMNNANNPSMMDQYLIENIIGEQYPAHLDLSGVGLPEELDDQQNDVIEIDDNSDDNKLLPRYDMSFPLDHLYLMHNDFHFLESDNINMATSEVPVTEISRLVSEVPLPKESMDIPSEGSSQDFPNFIQGKKDPMMNTSVRPTTNKINVKNIELMKN